MKHKSKKNQSKEMKKETKIENIAENDIKSVTADNAENEAENDVESATADNAENEAENNVESATADNTENEAENNVKNVTANDDIEAEDTYESAYNETFAGSENEERQNEISEAMAIFSELDEVKRKEKEKEKKKKEKKANSADTSLKVVGITSIVVAVIGFFLILACVYFMIVQPTYDKTSYLSQKIVFSEIPEEGDTNITDMKPLIKDSEVATDSDAADEETSVDKEEQ